MSPYILWMSCARALPKRVLIESRELVRVRCQLALRARVEVKADGEPREIWVGEEEEFRAWILRG